jgi:hypothetical protein
MNITDENPNEKEVLINKINNFDMYYEMSDSNVSWLHGHQELEFIKQHINHQKNIYDLLNDRGKQVYNRYLNNDKK